jgi:proton-translocating NADH-quinone oxidoreductase chain N
LLLLIAGLSGMVLAADLFTLYLFSELMNVTAYALVSFRRRTETAIEAGFKYLIMGTVAASIILLGISFVYRETGSTAFPLEGGASGLWVRAGAACFLVGFGLKSALVPLHTWLPDAHGRAPSSISALLSGIIVPGAFYTLLKVCLGMGVPAYDLGTYLIVSSALNMVVGNSMALVQENTKRLLAYSTVTQMGYLMFSVGVGLRYGVPLAIQAAFFLIVLQAVTKGLAFLCKGAFHFYCDATTVSQLGGMATSMPMIGTAFCVALVGLAGIPPLAGFAGKWFVVQGALRSTDALGTVGLAVFLLNSLLALGYYLPLIGKLFSRPVRAFKGGRVSVSRWMTLPIVVLAGLVLVMGLYPGPWLDRVSDAGAYLLVLGR